MGLLRRVVEFLSVDVSDRAKGRDGPEISCRTCRHWTGPDALENAAVAKRAREWAQKHGYGRCEAPGAPRDDLNASKRFTRPEARCRDWTARA